MVKILTHLIESPIIAAVMEDEKITLTLANGNIVAISSNKHWQDENKVETSYSVHNSQGDTQEYINGIKVEEPMPKYRHTNKRF